jgi:hypothetical protein
MAEELWLATADQGLCAALYSASEVTAKVGSDAQKVKVIEETDYPFSDVVKFVVRTDKPVNFPLYLRIPGWCDGAGLQAAGVAYELPRSSGSFIVIDRQWTGGDEVVLKLPRAVRVRKWEKNHDSVSVDYGALTFALKIGEKWEHYGNRKEGWPEWEVTPTTAWNYGLAVDDREPAKSFVVRLKKGPLAANPWTPDNAPFEIVAKGRKIPQWTLDANGLINPLQDSPAKSAEEVEEIVLIPMGAARLRITAFPRVTDAASGHEWKQ